MSRAAVAFAIGGAAAGCRIDPIDVNGLPCPCPDEWFCDPTTNTCTRELTGPDPDAAIDGGADGGIDLLSGLEWYFRFDQTSGQRIEDSAPQDRAGWAYTAAQVMWTQGVVGGGMHFNGTLYQSFIVYPSTSGPCGGYPPITGSLTASAWVKFDSFHEFVYSLGDVVAMYGSSGGNGGGWGIGASDGCGTTTASISISPPENGYRVNRCGTTPLAVDTWYHITGVYDAGARTMDVYLNGVLDNGPMTPGSPPIPSASQALTPDVCPYVAASANQNNLLHGTLDEFRLYSRALTAAEVAELYRISQ